MAAALGEAIVARAAHGAADDLGEGAREAGAEASEVGRIDADDLVERPHDAPCLKGRASREGLVEHDAERPEVGAGVDVALAARLLGRHVRGRPDGAAGARELRVGGEPRDAEIEHPRVERRALAEEDVGGLEVAVHHAPRVRVLEGLAHLRGDGERLGGRERRARET